MNETDSSHKGPMPLCPGLIPDTMANGNVVKMWYNDDWIELIKFAKLSDWAGSFLTDR